MNILYVSRAFRPGENWQLLGNILSEQESISLVSLMRTGSIFIDGPHISYQFYLGDELTVKASPCFLNAYVKADVNDIFIHGHAKN